ncbi:LOW QUALITY PROTEIN: uncharacterized protein LACBIDRAFT_399283 [Laccaria bicolor S238N-H82]|uniref:Predicted protein n=1 Tax=Laccaria bicolor (strain S238N-H82 / ATCC MYA-4686) TaxID=486041 RepID=B0DS91_LACBS|nr:LOW QUALITY PROTEIN: uncharacterized protein LACBIDRAFT_399283 [Laccaria bicolor S238N-H82]EDR02506.1 predicted protein [Laccaria bicolor S238N-H82]|eukprot:XP_001886869.1 predicted protein [Laccaria bicolor S238N-H82]
MPYESLHAVVSCGVKPWFNVFVGTRGRERRRRWGWRWRSKLGIPMTKKKFAELELGLLHLQQNVEIPEASLVVHPVIQRAVELAQSQGQRSNISHIPSKLLTDSTFLNSLHLHVNAWIKAIQAVTKLTRDVSSGTASQEINFWLSLERALEGIEVQLRSEEVGMVMDALRNAKSAQVHQLMKDFSLNNLLFSTDLDKVHESLTPIFSHLHRKLKLFPYPIRRSNLTRFMREVARKRSEKFIPTKDVPAHGKLVEWVGYLMERRKQHEQLAVMTGPTRGLGVGLGGEGGVGGGMDMEEEVKEAYEVVKRIDVLDVSVEGTEIWVTIIARLRDRLGTARNANEMFRVFSKFDALFVRPKIRGAIQEYQTQLIDSVKEDIKHLHDKFKTQYRFSEAYHMAQMRDLPPIAGVIIWARQIEPQLLTYMKGVEDVLGKGWELYAEGQKLQSESSAFRKKLDTRPVFDAWLHDINRMGVGGRLFEIVRLSRGGFQLAVNIDPQIITLFKEVRNLLWAGFQVLHAITNMAKDAKRVYPLAVSLMKL